MAYRIRNILCFPLRVEIGNGWFANFADCDARPFISGERMETAGQKTGEAALTALGTRMRGTVEDQLNDVPHLTRALDLLFHAPAGETETAAERKTDTWLPDLQVRLVRRGAWTLVCKGGNNGENHNHNDVGSFILSLHGEPAVVDAGNMVYTAKTFSGERYTLWNVQSAWHNLPEFGGCGQRAGGEYAARNVACLPDGMQLDMEHSVFFQPDSGEENVLAQRNIRSASGFTHTAYITVHRRSPSDPGLQKSGAQDASARKRRSGTEARKTSGRTCCHNRM